jgi:Histidine phosphatase superfamily (branch 2)
LQRLQHSDCPSPTTNLFFWSRFQAELLGTKFRHAMYPDPASGGGVLRLHATYRHDLKIKASDEGRVMKTAAAFTKGLLELEGNLTPILASLVTVEEKDRKMLDKGGNDEIKDDMDRCKEHMSSLLQSDSVMTEELAQKVAPNCPKSLKVSGVIPFLGAVIVVSATLSAPHSGST